MSDEKKRMGLACVAAALLAVAVALVVCALGRDVAYADIASGTSGGCDWVIDDAGALTISKSAGGDGVLGNCRSLGSSPWYPNRSNVKSIVVGQGVSTSEEAVYLFSDCDQLESADLRNLNSSSTVEMGGMFSRCSKLTSLLLPQGFGSSAVGMRNMFSQCGSLSSLDFPAGFGLACKDMVMMFMDCTSLASVTFPTGCGSAAEELDLMFDNCPALVSIDLPEGFGSAATNMHYMFNKCTSLVSVGLPSGFGSIATKMSSMFSGCPALVSIDLPEGFGSAATEAAFMFYGCGALTSMRMPAGFGARATELHYLFYDCPALVSIDLPEGFGSVAKNLNYAFYGCSSLSSLTFPGGCGSNATSIDRMCYRCSALVSIDLPEGFGAATVNMKEAFYYCSSLSSINLPEGFGSCATNMNDTFNGCRSIPSLSIPEGFGSAATDMEGVFAGCSSLPSLDLPEGFGSVATNMERAFSSCSSLPSMSLPAGCGSAATKMEGVFSHCSSLGSLNLPAGFGSTASTVSYMFMECKSLKSLCLPAGFGSTAEDITFMCSSCSSLEEISLPTGFGKNATWASSCFRSCSSLQSIEFPEGFGKMVQSYQGMFYWCRSLESITIPQGMGQSAQTMSEMFAYCAKLEEINTLNLSASNVTEMDQMFYGCSRLGTLDLSSWDTSKLVSMDQAFADAGKWRGAICNIASLSTPTASMVDAFKDSHWQYVKLGEGFSFNDKSMLSTPPSDGTYTGLWTDGVRSYTSAQLAEAYDGATMAGWWRWQTKAEAEPIQGESYYANGLWGGNMFEVHDPSATFQALCLNRGLLNPDCGYTKIIAVEDYLGRKVFKDKDCGFEPLGSNMLEALVALAYYGADQKTVWDFTSLYSKMGEGSLSWQWALEHAYASIPDASSYTLYIYEPHNADRQYLMSMECLVKDSDHAGGFAAKVVDDLGEPVRGAVFEVLDSTGTRFATLTSNASGEVGIWRRSASSGLPVGEYTISQVSAPSGFSASEATYAFSITDAATFALDGVPVGDSAAVPMRFVDVRNESHEGGRISIDLTVERCSIEFGAIVSVAGEAYSTTLTTDADGNASTGIRELPAGEYTVSVTRWPDGYGEEYGKEYPSGYPDPTVTMVDASTATVTVTGGSSSTVRFHARGATASGTVSGMISVSGTEFLAGEYRLAVASGAAFDETAKSADAQEGGDGGSAVFRYSSDGNSLGHTVGTMGQVAGEDPFMAYDDHAEDFTIMVEPDGSGLRVYLIADDDGLGFTNSFSRPVVFKVSDPDGNALADSEITVTRAGTGDAQAADMAEGPVTLGLGTYSYVVAQTRAQGGYAAAPPAEISVARDGAVSMPRVSGVSVEGNVVTVTNAPDPQISISARNGEDSSSSIPAIWGAQVAVDVDYFNLVPGAEYGITVRVVDAESGEVIALADGSPSMATRINPDTASGTVTYEISIDSSDLAGRNLNVDVSISAPGMERSADPAAVSVRDKAPATGILADAIVAYALLIAMCAIVLAVYVTFSRRSRGSTSR